MSGTFGIFGHPDAAAIVALGLHALQHRGQDAAGIVSFDGKRFHSERRLGLVGDAFSRREVIDRLPGNAAIGHIRHLTAGEILLRNVQPLFAELNAGGFAISHDGDLTNGRTLRRQLVREGALMHSTTDTEVILHLVARSHRNLFVNRFVEGLRMLEGAYAFVGLTTKKLVGARDPLGIRPLVLGKLDGCPMLASETCALDIIGAQYVRDVENGEVLIFDEDGAHSHKPFGQLPPQPCILEYIYFARPDSIMGGRGIYGRRKACGAELAREAPAAADMVVPVPDSGVSAAIGYAHESGIPYELGIIRSHYVGRSFIEPTDHTRRLVVRLKLNANRDAVAGKRIVLIDDSIVRGTTSVKIVQMMRDAGAREVHLRIASPPITHPDFYGIDMPEKDKLLAATRDLEGMRQFTGADSLAFLSIDGLYRAMGEKGRDPQRPQFTDPCFTGEYPTRLTDYEAQGGMINEAMPLAKAVNESWQPLHPSDDSALKYEPKSFRRDIEQIRGVGENDKESSGADLPERTKEDTKPKRDPVEFAVSSPSTVRLGIPFLVDAWAFFAKDRDTAVGRARETLGKDAPFRSGAAAIVKRDSLLKVELRAGPWPVEPPIQTLVWSGFVTNASFRVTPDVQVPNGRIQGLCKVTFCRSRIVEIPFDLSLSDETAEAKFTQAKRITGFISYASKDRARVLATVQGIQKFADVFMDVRNLNSGDPYPTRLLREIDASDKLFLFWSEHAKQSEWVQKEWRYGFESRGIDFIDPVPLVDPRRVPPPPELGAEKHFNDWALAFLEYEKIYVDSAL